MDPTPSTDSSAVGNPFEDTERPLALLVDGDNATAALIGEVLEETSKYGIAIIRRVYGDWTSPQLSSWKQVLQSHALSPSQQFSNVSGKNATDSSLIIEAMDILHGGRVRGFCIVSSDSDYTRLATRVREEGMFVMGVGRANTPAAFRNACHVFVALENLSRKGGGPVEAEIEGVDREIEVGRPQGKSVGPVRRRPVSLAKKPAAAEALDILARGYETAAREDGWAHLGRLGAALLKLDPAFDPRTFGYTRLSQLIQALPQEFEIQRPTDPADPRIYVKPRAKKR
jgi:NYN domain/OST-HTH/LOTUS domain